MRALAVALVLLVAVGVQARPAQAHSDVEASSPAADSTITTAPTELTLTFAGAIRGQFSTVVVTGPDGATYGTGKPEAVDKTLHQPLKPLVSGKYTVAWRVVSGDGHPLQGVYRFTANLPAEPSPSTAPTSAAAEPSPAAVEETEQTEAAVSADTGSSGLGIGLAIAGVVALALVVGFVVLARRRRTP